MKRYVFFYMMTDASPKIAECAPNHVQYWKGLPLNYFSGGPFSDRTGGMILFDCKNEQEAENMINQDPFIKNNLIKQKFIKEWNVQENVNLN